MSIAAKILARRIIDGHYQALTDNQEAFDASEAIQDFAEAYHQEQLKKMPKIGETGFGTTHPFIEQLCVKLIDECEHLAVLNGRSGTVSKYVRQTLCIELNLLGINELEHVNKLKP